MGFALCRRFGRGHVVGPVVAASEADALALVAPHVAAHAGRFLRLDTLEAEGPFRAYLEACGLLLFDTLTLMSLGRDRAPVGPAKIYGLASHRSVDFFPVRPTTGLRRASKPRMPVLP